MVLCNSLIQWPSQSKRLPSPDSALLPQVRVLFSRGIQFCSNSDELGAVQFVVSFSHTSAGQFRWRSDVSFRGLSTKPEILGMDFSDLSNSQPRSVAFFRSRSDELGAVQLFGCGALFSGELQSEAEMWFPQ